jgi:tight adherence protein C
LTLALAAEALAAFAAGSGLAGLALAARSTSRRRSGRRSLRLDPRVLWVAGGVVVASALPAPHLVTIPVAVVVALRVPRVLARRGEGGRRRAMAAELPQLLDLIAAASAAGLSAVEGLRRAVPTLRGPLGTELALSLDAVDLGARWRAQLSELAERLSLPDLRRAVTVLVRSETLGTSLTDATRDLAVDVRRARRASVAERARTAPVKMLFPLVFLILPAFLLLTVVPVLLTTVRSIR